MNTSARPIRVLQVVGCLNRGGTETWLTQVLRNLDRTRFAMDFLVHQPGPHDYEDDVRDLGGRILICRRPSLRHPLSYTRYSREMRSLLDDFGPYDVVHSHLDALNGRLMRVAAMAGIPRRIAHYHIDLARAMASQPIWHRLQWQFFAMWMERYATTGLACSRLVANSAFGVNWSSDPRFRVLYCGIDLHPFRNPSAHDSIRQELGIPNDAWVVGHVGRFDAQKNHEFLIEIAAEVMRRRSDAWLVLLGDGRLRSHIESLVASHGIRERCVLAGVRGDVARVMHGAMDVLCLPSLFEGLPIVALEAQAAGLPSVLSTAITVECDVVRSLIRRISLAEPPRVWADALLNIGHPSRQGRCHDGLDELEASTFDIRKAVAHLQDLYCN